MCVECAILYLLGGHTTRYMAGRPGEDLIKSKVCAETERSAVDVSYNFVYRYLLTRIAVPTAIIAEHLDLTALLCLFTLHASRKIDVGRSHCDNRSRDTPHRHRHRGAAPSQH